MFWSSYRFPDNQWVWYGYTNIIYVYIYIYIISITPPRHPKSDPLPPWTSFHFDSARTTIHSSPIVLFRHSHLYDTRCSIYSLLYYGSTILVQYIPPDVSDTTRTPRYLSRHGCWSDTSTTVRPTLCSCTREYKYLSLSYLTTDEINKSLHSMHRNEWRSTFVDFYLWSQTSLSSEILVRFLFSLLCCLGAQEFESDSNSWAKFIILR